MAFCERQWALIHIEQRWEENVLTVEGKHVHERADNPFENETRGETRTTRSVPIISMKLGLQGVADVIEYIRDDNLLGTESISLEGRAGRWKVWPVEYKRGRPKPDDRDAVQLCAQAIALEEMLNITMNEGYLYYNETRRRETVIFDSKLRDRVETLSTKMHWMASRGFMPAPKKEKHCLRCSLYEICQPDWNASSGAVGKYLAKLLTHEDKDLE
ncbi:MAG: CRISPR-associated protein Cas4 [Candidatus Thermoplasmatota archaeon]|nr:CRISPR-associated protein Cas4 [Candidatus Thermoplasmatota archaeon]